MIDTKKIKQTYQYADTLNIPDCINTIELLCDHIDELERKMKIAEDALEYYSNDMLYFPRHIIIFCNEKRLPVAPIYSDFGETALEALKQIRGEE